MSMKPGVTVIVAIYLRAACARLYWSKALFLQSFITAQVEGGASNAEAQKHPEPEVQDLLELPCNLCRFAPLHRIFWFLPRSTSPCARGLGLLGTNKVLAVLRQNHRRQSAFAPDAFTTFSYFARSLTISAANCSGVFATGSAINSPKRVFASGEFSAATKA